ncbi:hypothetical protein MtrunA17_Chr8g0386541 [Medicago truncatula]|uniref:Uncharacterized protein n=1 Tax=Medicago truncatula TaxID=3880 RepID=A0A396GQA9_MEDTR|nr:hypothetical protein MtrunA17_Chr8g0386541 [Medicago truncatula]
MCRLGPGYMRLVQWSNYRAYGTHKDFKNKIKSVSQRSVSLSINKEFI